MRKCVGCSLSREKKDMYRVVCYKGELHFDRTGNAKGRGAYICKNTECIEKARKKKALQKSFNADIPSGSAERVLRELENEER